MLIFQRQQETNRLADSGNYNLNILELNKHQELQKNQKHINNKMKGMCRISETNILNYEEEEKCTHSNTACSMCSVFQLFLNHGSCLLSLQNFFKEIQWGRAI